MSAVIPEDWKEEYTIGISYSRSISYYGIKVNMGTTDYLIRNQDDIAKNNDMTSVNTLDGTLGIGTPDIGYTLVIY
ncbi:MAG: hypothetical protein LBT51_03050 [Fusobacteriaceae bacterium]|nr:hypothetical protein [Fusobacteriaceae bacterium]